MENIGWGKKPEVQKGNIGERIVNEILSKKGYIVYRSISDGAHKIDFFAHKDGKEKRVICVEAKAKKRMAKHCATGFSYGAYRHYMEMQEEHKIDALVFFIDDFEECVYGAWLSELGEGREFGEGRNHVVVWGLEKMKFVRKLSKDELIELKEYTTENYNYSSTKKYFNS